MERNLLELGKGKFDKENEKIQEGQLPGDFEGERNGWNEAHCRPVAQGSSRSHFKRLLEHVEVQEAVLLSQNSAL